MSRFSTSTRAGSGCRRGPPWSTKPSACFAPRGSRTRTRWPGTSGRAARTRLCGTGPWPTASAMRRGDIYWVDFEPVRGSEVNKRRPAVVVSNDAANRAAERRGTGLVTVVPITSNTDRVLPFQTLLKAAECGLPRDSKAQAERVRTVAVERLAGRIGAVPAASLRRLDDALRLHLAL